MSPATGQGALAPGQVLLSGGGPHDVLDANGPERMRRGLAHGTQDQGRSLGAGEQRCGRAAVGDLQRQEFLIEADRPVELLHEHDHGADPGALRHADPHS